MTTYGVTADGFVRKPLSVILEELEAADRAAYGTDINTQAEEPLGQLNGIFADQLDQQWALAEAVYAAQNPDQNNGAAQDAIAAITGATRDPAAKSEVTLSVNLDAGAQLLPDRVVTDRIGQRYLTTEIVENANAYDDTLDVEAESEEFGPVFSAAGEIVNIETPVSGWSEAASLKAATAEPYTIGAGQTLTLKIDGGGVQTVTFVGTETTAAQVAAEINNDTTGLTSNAAGTVPRIESDNADGDTSSVEITGGTANAALGFPVALRAGMNALDVDPGEDLQTDADFRIEREQLLRATGAATVEAILADLLDLEGVDAARVFENVTEFTDGDGRPPHSVEAVILGDDPDTELDDRVGEQLFESVGAGPQTHRVVGASGRTITVTDSQGIDHDMDFNRAEVVEMDVVISVDVVADDYAGDAAVKAAIVAQGATYTIGEDVVAEANKASAFGVEGVYDITAYTIEGGTGNVVIGIRQVAEFDTTRVTVTSTPVIPS